MEIRGILIQKLGESSGTSEKTGMQWRNAEFLVEIPGNYTRKINFKVRDGQHNLIKRFEDLVGKVVDVSFEIDAHEHNGLWFNEVRAWGICEYRPEQKTAGEAIEEAKKEDSFADLNKGTDDLPF